MAEGTILTLYSADGEHYVQFSAPDVMTSNAEFAFPTTTGLAGQVLTSNGDGTLYFGAGGGGGGSPGGVNMSLQFNDAGVFGGASGALYNKVTNLLTIASLTVTTALTVPDGALALSKLQPAAASSKLLGSGSAGAALPYTEIALGTNLSIVGGTLHAASGGATTFDALTDTPSSKVGQALRHVRVNVGETALEYVTVGALTFLNAVSASEISSNAVTTAKIADANVTLPKIVSATANSVLLGSGQSGSGSPFTQIALGANLSMSGNTLNAASGSGGWVTTGNSGTSSSTNFVGTTDNVDFVVRTNNTERVRFRADVNAVTCSVDEFARTNNSGSLVISGGAIGSTRASIKFFGSGSGSPNETHLQASRFRMFTETGSTEYCEIQSGGMVLYGGVIHRGATNSGLTIRGGDNGSNGAGILLYGQTHATFANQGYYDAIKHTFRSQNGGKKFLEIDDTANVINVTPYGTNVGETTAIVFRERNNGGASGIGLKAPDTVNSSLVFTLPAIDGSNRAVLRTNGSQGLSLGYLNATVITATYNIASSDDVIICNNSANLDVNLPTLTSDLTGRIYIIKRLATSTGTVTIVSSAGPLSIEGTGSTYSVNLGACVQIMAKHPDLWLIVGAYP